MNLFSNAIVIAFAMLLLLALALLLRPASRIEVQRRRRRVRCPELGRTAECVVEQDLRTACWVAVKECSLLAKGEPVGCRQHCLKLMDAGRRAGPSA